jgi:hypothetical protein
MYKSETYPEVIHLLEYRPLAKQAGGHPKMALNMFMAPETVCQEIY